MASSSSRKRCRDEDISIRVAAGEAVPAESFLLRTFSSCARALPADAQQWDVSGLLLDGQPFSRETVSCWLQCGCSLIYGAAEDLGPEDTQQLSTVAGLTQVLAFADAVGSFDGLCKAACSQLQQLKFVVQLPEQTLELPLTADSAYEFKKTTQLVQSNLQESVSVGARLASAQQRRELQQQVAQQLAALLRLAHVLCLQPLLDVLHQFIWHNATYLGRECLLSGVIGLVFSNAMLEAAAGSSSSSSSRSREAYVSSVLSQPCSLTPDKVVHSGASGLLKPTGAPQFSTNKKVVGFPAELLRDFAGGRAGDKVTVALDLFGTTCNQGAIVLKPPARSAMLLPAQLMLGHSLPDAAALEAFLKADSAE